jgi:hypothetical protein
VPALRRLRVFVSRVPRTEPAEDKALPTLDPSERFEAKRANEALRTSASFLNNLAVGVVIAGILSPVMSGHPSPAWSDLALFLTAAVLHLAARTIVHWLYKRED